METIPFSEFAKLDIRIASIISAERVEGTDKLLKLKIKIGEEERTLAAGIAQHYLPENLVGKKIVVVTNLEPRKIRGIESQGMLLAAGSKETDACVLLCPEKDIEDGTKVS